MPTQSLERSSRRAATRRRVVVDDDGNSDAENVESTHHDEEEEEFTPAPAKKTRASPRRRTVAEQPTTPSRHTTSSRRTTNVSTTESIEPSHVFSPPESVAEEPASPSKKSPPKRRTVKDARAARQSRMSLASTSSMVDVTSLPTPEPSATPEPTVRQSTPLTDITEITINEQTPRATPRLPTPDDDKEIDSTDATMLASSSEKKVTPHPDVKPIDATTTKLQNPMDIVVRTRAIGGTQAHLPTVPKQRLTITYLVLTNFKSYAGRQQIGPFHASFSSVIGPNGSGKSNVIDSLLFVFGFRASKMRQGKISALIHNSSAFPDLEFCEVEVQFQEVEDIAEGGHKVMPDSRLVISRRAFKNNSSKYYINGRESTFTSVTTLLRDKGIDLDHKRFLILQGEVESIAQMKPKAANEHDDGLLEYLEDIIGTSKYKARIEEAAGETETLNEVCLEKSTRVQHVEKERNGLESKKDRALAHIRDENELAAKQSALYQIYVAECNDNIEVTGEACAQIQGNLDAELTKHKGRDTEIKRLEKQYKTGCQEYEKLERETDGVVKESSKLEKEAVKFEEKKKFLANKVKKLEKGLDAANFGVTETETAAKRSSEDVIRLNEEIAALELDMAVEEKELAKVRDSLKGKTQGISDQIAVKQKQLEPWSVQISEKQSAQAVARSELDILVERQTAGATAIADVEAKIVTLEEQREQKRGEMNENKSRHKQSLKELDTARKQLDLLKAQEPALLSKLSGARQKADEARASLSATQSQGNVLSSLTRLKESGRIEGFHGRLGNLGAIDPRYDVAITTACPALDNLVVDTVEVGQQCIEYLRKNDLGRANFILLDKLSRRDLSKIQTPENVPRLYDLIKSRDARFLPAFYSVLQNTLVAQDLTQANRIAYGAQRWRVVTLDGKLIDKSGTMSGGGTRIAKGGMSSKIAADTTPEQVKRYETDRDSLEATYSELQSSIREVQERVTALESEGPRLETAMQKLKLEVDSFDADVADAKARIKELSKSSQPKPSDRGKMASLEDHIDKLQTEIEGLQAETAGIEDEIKELQDKIMHIGGVKLRAQKGKVDGLKEQIDSIGEAISAAETSKVKAEKQHKKHLQAVVDAEAEMAKLSKNLAQIETDVSNHAERSASARQEAEAAEQALDDRKEENAQLKSKLDELLAEVNDTRTVELELRNKLEENNKILADNQKRLKYWSEKLDKLSMQNISDDGEEGEPEPTPELSRDELADLDKEDLKAAIAILEERTSQPVELSVLAEYQRRVNEHKTRLEDLNSALASRDQAKKRADELRRLRLEGFMQGFSIISLRLKEMYQMITMGGNAELELVDSLDPFSEGILFSVMPPKKSWKNIGNLSGGEKTLSSLALVFALHHYKPTPLYVMDEIDAALDFRNVSIVAAYIKERTKNAQFIVISLRNNMFELASRLVGVYKVNHMTKSATIENKDYVNQSA